jgi:large conductance mechanosensitive channel
VLKDFKAFLLRGNVVDLAVAVAIGAAFTAIITAFTTGIVTPLLTALGGGGNFDNYTLDAGKLHLRYGLVLSALINFLIIAAILFFLVVLPINKLMARRKTEPEVASTTKDCPDCLSSIPLAARRCAFCTSEQAA